MRLDDLYAGFAWTDWEMAWRVPFDLLAERQPHESISHKAMPTWEQHCDFVRSQPYAHWYLVNAEYVYVGAVYLTKQREVGVGILREYQRKGYATEAVRQLLELHPGLVLANINPANSGSIALFRKLGFAGPIQHTYEHP